LKNDYEIRGEVTAIFLKRKNGDILETLIDTVDLDRAKEFPNTWCASWSQDTQSFYCYGMLNFPEDKRVPILLHRWITDCPDDLHIDHYDNNTLNNCRGNLRFTTHAENHQNRAGAQKNNWLGIRGVCWNKRRQKWQAAIKVKNIRKHLGYFNTIKEAEEAVKAARGQHMPFSKEALAE